MKKYQILGFMLLVSMAFAQNNPWQQAVDYTMRIDVDAKAYTYDGEMEVKYTNNSPEDLERVFFHLYFNAFQPGSLMDERLQQIADPDGRMTSDKNGDTVSRIASLPKSNQGFHTIKKVKFNGKSVDFTVDGTLMEVRLPNALKSNTFGTFMLEWEAQVPDQIRRSGRQSKEGVEFSMAQWYPKIAAYDVEGWHTDEYIAREFYAPFGDFDVEILIDSDYVVGASGKLQNPQEVKGYSSNAKVKSRKGKSSWKFKANQIHDFAWAADPDFVVDKTQVPNGPEVYFVYQPKAQYKSAWKKVQPMTVKFFEGMNKHFGAYPWSTYTVVQGGDGGMEYGTVTLVTGERTFKSLEGVIFHEAAHSWFQHLMGTNETIHEWMDEGFTSYADALVSDEIWEANKRDLFAGTYKGYSFLALSGKEEPLSTHADYYRYNQAYGIAAYYKGAVMPHQLGYIIGEENRKRTFLEYYNQWKFRHPTPNDFKRVAEKVSGIQLKWYFWQFVNSTRFIDYGISVKDNEVLLRNNSDFAMPLDVLVTYEDGSKELFYIPLHAMRGEKQAENFAIYKDVKRTVLRDHTWTNNNYSFKVDKSVQKAEIDPTGRMADVKLDDNVWQK